MDVLHEAVIVLGMLINGVLTRLTDQWFGFMTGEVAFETNVLVIANGLWSVVLK